MCTFCLSCFEAAQGRVLRALWAVHWRRLATAAGFRLLQNLCAWSGPFLLQQLLSHLQAGAAICKPPGHITDTLPIQAIPFWLLDGMYDGLILHHCRVNHVLPAGACGLLTVPVQPCNFIITCAILHPVADMRIKKCGHKDSCLQPPHKCPVSDSATCLILACIKLHACCATTTALVVEHSPCNQSFGCL